MNYRRIFTISAVIVTAVGFLITVKLSERFSDRENLPEDNFVKVVATYYMTSNICDDLGLSDTGDICQNERIPLSSSTASGVVFKSIGDTSYILTADHFCNPNFGMPASISGRLDFDVEISAVDSKGRTWSAPHVYSSEEDDLCLLSSDIEILNDIEISSIYPVPGDKVSAISAPHGIHDRNVALHFTGTFSGCNYDDICFYTIPAAPGSSGSLILNTEGKIVGMIQMTSSGFDALSLGVGLTSIRRFLLSAEEQLQVDLI